MAYRVASSLKCLDAGCPLSPPAVTAFARTRSPNSTTATKLLPLVPRDAVSVSESGFFRREELEMMAEWGVQAFLIGESLLRAPDPGAQLELLLRPEKGPPP